jgi:hypothetical protein
LADLLQSKVFRWSKEVLHAIASSRSISASAPSAGAYDVRLRRGALPAILYLPRRSASGLKKPA